MKSVYTGGEKVAEFESYDELRVGENKPAFIYEGNEIVYPNPVKDGLVLWYDFSGRTNADGQRGIAEDLSGNGNHGTLQNFNFTAESGYVGNKLKFDGIDDEVIVGTFSDSRFHQPAMTVEWTGIIREEQPLSGINHIFSGGYVAGWALGFHGQYNGLMATVKDSNGASGYRISYPIHNPIRDIPYNLVMVFQQGSKKEYLNGVLVSEDNNFGFPDYTSTPQVRIAKSAYQSTLSCKTYNRPLTPEEIAHNYAIEKERFGIE